MIPFAHAHPVQLDECLIDRLARAGCKFRLRDLIGVGLALTNGERLRKPQEIAGRQRADHEALSARAIDRRFKRTAELLIEFHLNARHLPHLQGEPKLDAAPRHTLADQASHVALDRRQRLRNAQLQIEISMIERSNGHGDRRTLVLMRDRCEACHGLNHEHLKSSHLVIWSFSH